MRVISGIMVKYGVLSKSTFKIFKNKLVLAAEFRDHFRFLVDEVSTEVWLLTASQNHINHTFECNFKSATLLKLRCGYCSI